MIVEIDATVVPPRTSLLHPEDQGRLEVRVRSDTHVWLDVETLAGLGPSDPDWRAGLEKMRAYAEAHGWTDPAGRVRAHVVTDPAGPAPQSP